MTGLSPCPYCDGGIRRRDDWPTCGRVTCRQAHARARGRVYQRTRYVKKLRAAGKPVHAPVPRGEESAADIEARLAAARAARLADERRTGRRRYVIEDGWQQRPGVADHMGRGGWES